MQPKTGGTQPTDWDYWKRLTKHGAIALPLIGVILSFLYDFGFVDIPASRSSVTALEGRVTQLEASHSVIGRDLQELKGQGSAQNQKLEDVKQNVDRLVDVLIGGGVSRRGPPNSNFHKQ